MGVRSQLPTGTNLKDLTMKAVSMGIFAAIQASSYAAPQYHPAPYHPAPYHPAPAPVYHPAPAPYKPAPPPAYKPAPHKPAPYVDYVDEPVYRCPNNPYCDEAPHALAHLQYEIDALRQRQALVDAHGAAVLALKQEPNQPFVGGVYY